MASTIDTRLSGRRPSQRLSRLQRRAPASLQINPVTEWNVAIPLLSPLVESPDNLTAEIKSLARGDSEPLATVEKPAVVMKEWRHPAAPFCYDQAPFLPFVCTGDANVC